MPERVLTYPNYAAELFEGGDIRLRFCTAGSKNQLLVDAFLALWNDYPDMRFGHIAARARPKEGNGDG